MRGGGGARAAAGAVQSRCAVHVPCRIQLHDAMRQDVAGHTGKEVTARGGPLDFFEHARRFKNEEALPEACL